MLHASSIPLCVLVFHCIVVFAQKHFVLLAKALKTVNETFLYKDEVELVDGLSEVHLAWMYGKTRRSLLQLIVLRRLMSTLIDELIELV